MFLFIFYFFPLRQIYSSQSAIKHRVCDLLNLDVFTSFFLSVWLLEMSSTRIAQAEEAEEKEEGFTRGGGERAEGLRKRKECQKRI